MRAGDPMLRMLRRVVVGFAVGFALVVFGVFLLSVAVADDGAGGEATTSVLTPVLGWAALSAGPAVGLRIGGLPWPRALWAAPVLPVVVLLLDLAG